MYLVNLRSGWKLCWSILFSIMLIAGWAITPAQAHCNGRHTGTHEHCIEPPPPGDFNPEIVWFNGFNASDRTIGIANGDGSNPTTILSEGRETGVIGSVSWSPDGKEILLTRGAGEQGPAGVYSLPIFDGDSNSLNPRGNFSVGTPTLVVESDGSLRQTSRWSPVIAPDLNFWIAYIEIVVDLGTGETGEEVFLFNPDTDTTIQLTETGEDYLNFTWSHDATRIAVHTTPANVENEDIKIYSLTAVDGNLVVEPAPPVSLLLDNDFIYKDFIYLDPESNAALLRQDAVDQSSLSFVDWANTKDRLIVRSDGDSGRNRLWIIPVPVKNTQEEVASGTILALDDDRLAVFRDWPNWSPDDTALLYRRSGKGGICEVPSKKKGKTKSTTNFVIGMLDNPVVEDDPPGTDDPDKIECDVRPDDEIVLDSNGLAPEWWRGGVGFIPPLP